MRILPCIVFCALALPEFSLVALEPNHGNLRYSKKHDRCVLDLWTIDSNRSAPLVVFFHGGGFRAGDKSRFRRSGMLRRYHPKGVAFASVNYPFINHMGNDYFKLMDMAADSVKFLRAKAKKFGLDKDRISVSGISAGALISCHVGHGRELGISSVFPIQQPMGTPLLTYPKLRKDGPPILLFTYSGRNDRVHHPDNAALVRKRCEELGVACEVYGTKQSGLPQLKEGQKPEDVAMRFFFKNWNLPFPGK